MLTENHPDTAAAASTLASLSSAQGKYPQAEPLYQRALAIREQQLGPLHPDTATSHPCLAALYRSQGKYQKAELLFRRALSIREQQLGADHPDTAESQWWIATLLHQQGKLDEARAHNAQALGVFERRLGTTHPSPQALRADYERLLHQMQPEALFPLRSGCSLLCVCLFHRLNQEQRISHSEHWPLLPLGLPRCPRMRDTVLTQLPRRDTLSTER